MLNVVDAMIVAMGFPVVFIQFRKYGFSTATISTATISTTAISATTISTATVRTTTAIPQTAESVFIQVYGFVDTQMPGNFIGFMRSGGVKII